MRFVHLLASVTLFSGITAHADTTYNYQGPRFTSVSGSYTTSDSVIGFFTLAQPLGPDSTTTVLGPYDPGPDYVVPLSFSFTDGVQTLSSFNGDYLAGSFSTSSNGDISTYFFATLGAGGGTISISFDTDAAATSAVSIGTGTEDSTAGAFTTSTDTTATPEPSSFALLGTGILCAAGLAKRRYACSTH